MHAEATFLLYQSDITFCMQQCAEMSEAEGSNSSKQAGLGEGTIKKAKEGKYLNSILVI